MKLKSLGHYLGLTQKPDTSSEVLDGAPTAAVPEPSTDIMVGNTDSVDEAGQLEPSPEPDSISHQPEITLSSSAVTDETVDSLPEEVPPVADIDVSSSIQSIRDDQQPSTQDTVMDEKSGAISYQEEQLAEGRDQLSEFLKACEGSYGVIVSSIDGNSVVHHVSQELPVERLANMTSSLLALGETIARESLQRLCKFVILENSDGRVVCLRINRVLMLTCITGKQSNLGMVLNIGQKTSDGLAEIF